VASGVLRGRLKPFRVQVWDNVKLYNKNLGGIADGDLGVYTAARYLAEAAGINLVGGVHVETVVGQMEGGFVIDSVAETEYALSQLACMAPRAMGIVAFVDLAGAGVEAALDAHAAAGGSAFVGVRFITNFRADGKLSWPQVARGDYHDGVSAASLALASGLALVDKRDLTFDMHANWFQLGEAATFLAAHAPPSLRVVVDHSGVLAMGEDVDADTPAARRDAWEANVRALAARPLTYMKLSALEYVYPGWMAEGEQSKAAKAMVAVLLDAFGPDRCMFASNYPVDKFSAPGSALPGLYGAFWDVVESLGVAEADRVKLFSGTAMEVYKLDRTRA